MQTTDRKIPTMLTIKEASEAVNLSAYRIRQLCITNQIVYIRAGSKYLVNLDKLIDYLNGGDQA